MLEEAEEIQVNLLVVDDDDIVFLTKEEWCLFSPAQNELEWEESEDYKQGFENDIMEVHRIYNLRSKKNSNTPKKQNPKTFAKKSPETDPRKHAESSKKIAKYHEESDPDIPTRKPPINPIKIVSDDIPKTNKIAEVAAKIILEKIYLSLPKT